MQAIADPSGEEKRWLDAMLLKTFTEADKNFDGCIDPSEFDAMVTVRTPHTPYIP